MTADGTRAPLDEVALRAAAIAPTGWRTLDVVPETGSTNADLIARSAAGEDISWAVLIAEHQTAGRGRNGRSWSAVPRAQITMSVGVPAASLPPAAWGWVPLITGLAVVDAVAAVTGIRAGLKWPNDVLAGPDGRKLAGILAEVATPSSAIVVGVGLNVSLRRDELPEPAATSLSELGAADPDRAALIGALLAQLRRRVDGLLAGGGADAELAADYVANSLTISSRVRASLPGDRQVVGDARGIDDQGRLRIDTGTDVVVVSAGDIVHLRPV
ncbi:biotin--[acetyl-CoA-carboxylase] ligase [Mycobacterium antarcticum]|uniref:biotin--[acetyl-CoA-carboxylase] ligase n=1 Tax=unclassified Mycolicibacterium TaxID=2636767 RepID=UPI0023937358|nr:MULTISPECIES: biotin--[acetyl-CoA-carboxylase] ligase [unclassified Mycolicibacterium]BDX33864.1 biotin--[acetyl-CoA-carboxylase] ligase [Mycolicibacterium sp. TUM20985]GLP77038.1 biotin--[acetyl-CoA-carboxylase] ligase [Mycolicibacterium sp. TUM20983]